MKRMHVLSALSVLLGALAVSAQADELPAIYQGADPKQGDALIAEHRCDACHARRVGGDGSAIYKPQGRINNPGALRGMVDYCSVQLNLGLFPEDVNSVAAALNRRHYHFK